MLSAHAITTARREYHTELELTGRHSYAGQCRSTAKWWDVAHYGPVRQDSESGQCSSLIKSALPRFCAFLLFLSDLGKNRRVRDDRFDQDSAIIVSNMRRFLYILLAGTGLGMSAASPSLYRRADNEHEIWQVGHFQEVMTLSPDTPGCWKTRSSISACKPLQDGMDAAAQWAAGTMNGGDRTLDSRTREVCINLTRPQWMGWIEQCARAQCQGEDADKAIIKNKDLQDSANQKCSNLLKDYSTIAVSGFVTTIGSSTSTIPPARFSANAWDFGGVPTAPSGGSPTPAPTPTKQQPTPDPTTQKQTTPNKTPSPTNGGGSGGGSGGGGNNNGGGGSGGGSGGGNGGGSGGGSNDDDDDDDEPQGGGGGGGGGDNNDDEDEDGGSGGGSSGGGSNSGTKGGSSKATKTSDPGSRTTDDPKKSTNSKNYVAPQKITITKDGKVTTTTIPASNRSSPGVDVDGDGKDNTGAVNDDGNASGSDGAGGGGKENNIGKLIGIAVGVIVAVILLVAAVVIFYQRRRYQKIMESRHGSEFGSETESTRRAILFEKMRPFSTSTRGDVHEIFSPCEDKDPVPTFRTTETANIVSPQTPQQSQSTVPARFELDANAPAHEMLVEPNEMPPVVQQTQKNWPLIEAKDIDDVHSDAASFTSNSSQCTR